MKKTTHSFLSLSVNVKPGKLMSNSGKKKYLIDIARFFFLVRPFFRTTHCDIFISNALPELLTEGAAICQHLLRQ
jgi:hypothetical protein